nr:tgf beta family [Hymenolepis microstoma]
MRSYYLVALLCCAVFASCTPTQNLYRQSRGIETESDTEPWMIDQPPTDHIIQDASLRQRQEEEEQREAIRLAEQQEFERQINIEKFKRTILQRLHMSEPPPFAFHGGFANRTNSEGVMEALPMALRNRIISQLRSEEVIDELPPDRTDERETLILLKHLHWKLPKVSSATFGISMADDIGPARIQSAFLQFETRNPLLKGQRLEVWEVFLTQEDEDELINAAVGPDLLKQYSNLTWMFDQTPTGYTSLPAPAVIRSSYDSIVHHQRSGSLRIREGRLAETYVSHGKDAVQVTFDISGAFSQWLSHRHRMPMMRKLVRSIIVICPKCDSRTDPVEVDKGILEIRHRNVVKRTRRKADAKNELTVENPCSTNGIKFSCCTQPFTLDFADVEWNTWIIHPKSVIPNYCHGSCQSSSLKKTSHSEMMQIYRNLKYDRLSEVQRGAMLSCCHPIKMASLSVLYLDLKNELKMDTLHNIIVQECGCS